MIEAAGITKNFDDIKAVDNVSLKIEEGKVFGLIGTNGAGKSTFLRMAAGVLKQDVGSLTIDGEAVFENPPVKQKFFYIPDELYFFSNSTPDEMALFYSRIYPAYSMQRYEKLMDSFELNRKRKINTFSKGMKKQLAIILGLSSMTKYMYCDETFDGLDPVMRQGVKSLFADDIAERGFTPVIASHNLRELEDICDSVGLLHQGGMLLSEDIDSMKSDIHKIQYVPGKTEEEAPIKERLNILSEENRGSLITITVKGNREQITDIIKECEPVFMEVLPLSLEEIFISETGVEGYDIKKLIF
ncbi:MAG: ABC transporter ATP-binding protein [Lachnospiraceae bacterium]|nr:ABC transporter ATP-binding protein [Lachnospiraceae bacterium]